MRPIPEQRDSEFYQLERLAMGYLTTPHTIPKADDLEKWRFCLRLWHYPSFSESRAWALYQRHEGGSRQVRSLVRQVTWDQPRDSSRLLNPLKGLEEGFHSLPTIEVRDRPVDSAELESRFEELTGISFPAFASSGIGIDGEIFGIDRRDRGSIVEWWCDGPDSWSELTSWATRMRDWLISVTSLDPDLEFWKAPPRKLP